MFVCLFTTTQTYSTYSLTLTLSLSLCSSYHYYSKKNSRNRNLLGLDDINDDDTQAGASSFSSEQMVEQRNDDSGQLLKEKVETLKRISIDIESQVRESNSLLDDLNLDLNNARALLSNTMKKLSDLAQTATSRHMLYLVAFVVLVERRRHISPSSKMNDR
ncbi:hypothetical protein DFA_07610 [Cavenderia fasciculata]|uniref:t-SNARE coiled-coil homology domain-containing protein n=1 Tax=Cavenderia fasciculata TaxID=261658 RepID=F4Q646_CACFS|nr:uncharacterized protein DFA_07610 [Cavenderia fasciculata]EGG16632.1 hypothetical protein DFA_07610 [Cavenderia fasciculata]|eukprot:XP_004355106.1 hypothetical protein DFA_07610 [Cavenderia fasciculata]